MIRKQLQPSLKIAVLHKCSWKCTHCGDSTLNHSSSLPWSGVPREDRLEVDHIIPLRFGGLDDISNMQILCHTCHCRKTAKEHRIKTFLPILSELSKTNPELLQRFENVNFYGISIEDMRKFLHG